jgi:hypothetical protein
VGVALVLALPDGDCFPDVGDRLTSLGFGRPDDGGV